MFKIKFKDEPSLPDFVVLEKAQAEVWAKKNIVKKYLTKNVASKKKFSFLDGPITANNPMGVHHARGRTYKDLWQRYKTMQGFAGRYQNGFDCQGLWVEVEVEKELGFKSKKDIEKYGVEKFVDQCKARVLKYSAIQTQQSQRLGMWCDWDNSYFTMSDENNYAIWQFLKVCHERGWLYKGHDVVPWCPRCETAISQHEILTEDYKEVTHDSVFLALPLKKRDNEFLLVWTTTPWTLPANVAVAVDKDFSYALIKTKSGKKLWLLKELGKTVLGEDYDKEIKTVKGKDLVGLEYTPLFFNLEIVKKTPYHRVVATDKLIMPITTTEGTGLVHMATGTGAEDFQLGKKLGLPVLAAIGDDARYLAGFGELAGLNAKKHPELIFDRLGEFKYKILKYKHRYPACWRCKSELVWKVTDEFYIAMDKPDPVDPKKQSLRQQIIKVSKKINWIPEFGLERELDWLNNMHDWLISKKNRFWGLALPIYECFHCHSLTVIGSKAELEEKAASGFAKFNGHSPHKPWIDEVKVKCNHCGRPTSRIEPVGNPWLDAGIVPFSTLPKGWFPAEFITEAFPGQFKNWFYAMLVMATVLKKTNPYQTVLGYESVVGEDGRPMHKSWGNAIEFNEGAEKIGVDVMRFLYAKVLPTAVLPFGYKAGAEVKRQFFLTLWNSYRFFMGSAALKKWQPPAKLNRPQAVLDQWILSRLQVTIKTVTESLDKYYSAPATEALEKLVADFSLWYIRRSRDRISEPECLITMHRVLVSLSQLLAPFTPYLADYLYAALTGEESVHLSVWPKVDSSLINQTLENKMIKAREVVEKIHSQRKALNLPVRQPLNQATVSAPEFGSKEVQQLILAETNLKKLKFFGKGDGSISLDTKITAVLKAEGEARGLMRQIQAGRKAAGMAVDAWVDVELPDWPQDFADQIKQKTLVRNLIKKPQFKVVGL